MRYPWMLLCGFGFFYCLGTLTPQPKVICPPPVKVEYSKPQVPLQTLKVSATVYYPTGNPTFDGTTIPKGVALTKVRWCALTHDLLRKTGWDYGDTLLVYGSKLPSKYWGLYILHDKTHSRIRNRVDLLTSQGSYSDKWEEVKLRKFTVNK